MTRGHAEWYRDGLQFECTMCGACCTGPPGFVLFSAEEAEEISRYLGLSVDDFLERFTHESGAGRSLNEVETEHGHDCVFLDRTTLPGQAVCSLYEHRPTQCRTFPFWPEHIASPASWRRIARQCEGIGRGPVVPVTEIRISCRIQAESRTVR